VTFNYRLGALGFLDFSAFSTDEHPFDTNLGLRDQIAALTWVRDNIARFGGDPSRVTVFGESAGAMSIGVLLSMPRAEGLFSRAVLQSGAAHHVVPAAEAARVGARLAQVLGVPPTREAVADVPVDRLLDAQAQVDLEVMTSPDPSVWGAEVVASTMPFHPVVDGDVVPGPPIERIAAAAGSDVDVLVGTNTDDWRMFPVLGGFIDQVTDEMLSGPVEVHGPRSLAAFGLPVGALPAYRAAQPEATPGDLLADVLTDWWVRVPAIRLADAHAAAAAATYMYEFAWPSPAFGGRLGACHALEIPFVFDTLDLGRHQMLGGALGEHPPQELADAVHGAWVSFARDGDPGWPRYDLDHRYVMRLATEPSVVGDPYARERALWSGVR
jgi:para-nitrobenzyl esterase